MARFVTMTTNIIASKLVR